MLSLIRRQNQIFQSGLSLHKLTGKKMWKDLYSPIALSQHSGPLLPSELNLATDQWNYSAVILWCFNPFLIPVSAETTAALAFPGFPNWTCKRILFSCVSNQSNKIKIIICFKKKKKSKCCCPPQLYQNHWCLGQTALSVYTKHLLLSCLHWHDKLPN